MNTPVDGGSYFFSSGYVDPFYFIFFSLKGCLDLAFHSLSGGRGHVPYKSQLNSVLFKLLLGLALLT